MPGTFDEIIKQQMRGSQRDLGYQDARDRAARQMNMAQRGINSTAMPMQQQPAPQPPSMDALIQSQLGEEMPVPGPRPMQEPTPDLPIEMGDARVAENSQLPPSDVEQAIAEQMGDASVAENSQLPPPPTAQPLPHPQSAQGGGGNGSTIAMIAAGLVGSAGIASLLLRYRMGDPDAANMFRATGISPDELEMFAGDVMPQRSRGTGAATEQDTPQRKSGAKTPAKSNAPSTDDKAGSKDTDKNVPATGRDRFEKRNKSPPGSTSGIKPVRPKLRFK